MLWCLAPLGFSAGDDSANVCKAGNCASATDDAAQSRKPSRRQSAGRRVEALDTRIKAHFKSIRARQLIELLAPKDWQVDFDVADEYLEHQLLFHAETSRRRAMNKLLDDLGLQGIFYPGSQLIVITEPREQ